MSTLVSAASGTEIMLVSQHLSWCEYFLAEIPTMHN